LASAEEFVEHTTTMAVAERSKLQKHFTRFDIYFFLICTIVGVGSLGQIAAKTGIPKTSLHRYLTEAEPVAAPLGDS